ncbi:MAG TPA: antiterminator LoaP [Clostridia bacterium]|nr:antiterminator LoaP [Clostridia bacterium]
MISWCVFCKTGSEKNVVQLMTALDNKLEAIAPIRVLQEKRKGKWQQREQILFPGYVFLYAEEEIDFELIKRIPGFYKVLGNKSDFKKLRGTDYEYSMWIYRHQGHIETSKVLTIGRTVKVIDGPLLDGFGTIVKLDKHKRRIWVDFEFDGRTRTVSLSAECVEME